jgi:receptor protein-tyrosine kinase
VSTIEQAAKRLEQLRRAGVDVPDVPRSSPAAPEAAVPDSVPLRAVRELDAQGVPVKPPSGPDIAASGGKRRTTPRTRVEIDLARLSAAGYITPNSPRSRIAEEFRVIKRPLLTNARGKSAAPVLNANRVMVTSSLASEGKTFVTLNLAMSMAMELDTSVLLVDADAPRPAVLERLGLPTSKGLLDLLSEPALGIDEVILETNVERLWILPAGMPQAQSTELLASEAMSRLVERLAAEDPDRIVLFDTPPLLASTESRVLAVHMGQVILVVEADNTPQNSVAEAMATIENCPVVMTLLNKAPANEIGTYYGSYGT